MTPRRAFEGAALVLGLDQGNALKAFRASVGDEEGHEADCILAREGEQAEKTVKFTTPLYHWNICCQSSFRALT